MAQGHTITTMATVRSQLQQHHDDLSSTAPSGQTVGHTPAVIYGNAMVVMGKLYCI